MIADRVHDTHDSLVGPKDFEYLIDRLGIRTSPWFKTARLDHGTGDDGVWKATDFSLRDLRDSQTAILRATIPSISRITARCYQVGRNDNEMLGTVVRWQQQEQRSSTQP